MAVFCDRARTVYFPVPKAACTSLKVLFWEINHERPRPEKISVLARLRRKLGANIEGETLQTEEGYRTLDFDPAIEIPPGYDRLAVIRDPLARLQSAWSNKVNHRMFARHRELRTLAERGLTSSPTFAEFIDRYEDYCAWSVPVQRHTGSFAQYLGEDIDWYDRVFTVEQLADLEAYLRERVGNGLAIPMRNQSRPDTRDSRLSQSHRAKLATILESDYRLLGRYYDLDRSMQRFLKEPG